MAIHRSTRRASGGAAQSARRGPLGASRPGAASARVRFAAAAALSSLAFFAPQAALASSAGVCSQANVDAYLAQGKRTTAIDKQRFYGHVKSAFKEYRKPGLHYEGTDAIIDHWNARPEYRDVRWLAYILATAYLETAFKMYPVKETLREDDADVQRILQRSYERRGRTGKVYWLTVPETGRAYFGRGYVQLTWDWNYKRADKRFGIDINSDEVYSDAERVDSYYWNPDFALDPVRSIRITYDGMVYGWYTGHCLLRHIREGRREDFVQSRRIINGMNKARTIAGYATQFLASLRHAEVPAPGGVLLNPSASDGDAGAGGGAAGGTTTPVEEPPVDPGETAALDADAIAAIVQEAMAGVEDRLKGVEERIASLETSAQETETTLLAERRARERLERELSSARAERAEDAEMIAETTATLERAVSDLSALRGALNDTVAQLEQTRQSLAANEAALAEAAAASEAARRAAEGAATTAGDAARQAVLALEEARKAQADAAEKEARARADFAARIETQTERLEALEAVATEEQVTAEEIARLRVTVRALERRMRKAEEGFWDWVFGSE